ncbi:MAG TPA: hypothetical protein VF124_03890 [Gaiellaceae bacterium]
MAGLRCSARADLVLVPGLQAVRRRVGAREHDLTAVRDGRA